MIRIYLQNWIVLSEEEPDVALTAALACQTAMQAKGFVCHIEPDRASPDGNGYVCSTEAEYDAMQAHCCGG